MKPILTLPIIELLSPGLIGLVNIETKRVQVIHTRSMAGFIDRIYYELDNYTYKTPEIQQSYNNNKLELVLLSKIDLTGIDPSLFPLVMRYKQNEECERLASLGYSVIWAPNALKLHSQVVLLRGYPPQVKLTTARNNTFFVQKQFDSIDDAEKYNKETHIFNIMLDTKGIDSPYKNNTGGFV